MRGLIKLLVLVLLAGLAWRYAGLYGLREPMLGAGQHGAGIATQAAPPTLTLLGTALQLAGIILRNEWDAMPAPFNTLAMLLAWAVLLTFLAGLAVGLFRFALWALREIREAID